MQVHLHRIDKELPLPKYETAGSLGFDLSARVETTIPAQNLALIPSNLVIKCPKEVALMILPRSSTFRKKSLIFPHSIGLIDRDYCGPEDEIMLQVFNFGSEEITINKGEKIAQGIFVNISNAEFKEVPVEFLGPDSRGGFGSTDALDPKPNLG